MGLTLVDLWIQSECSCNRQIMAASVPAFLPLVYPLLDEKEQLRRLTSYADIMETRRTVREFSSEPISFAVIEQAIRAASSAPSGANKQPWQFVVVENSELKRRLRVAAEHEEWEFYNHRATPEWLHDIFPLGTEWQKPFLETAPCLIVVFCQDYELRLHPDGTHGKHNNYYVNESVGIAVGMLLSALHLAGLATMVHTTSPMGFLNRELGRPENEHAFAVIPVGFPAENARVPNLKKKSLEDVLTRL